jgi:hypothetical protein
MRGANVKTHQIAIGILTAALLPFGANADCVIGAKMKISFTVLDTHTVMLRGGGGKDILIKTFSFLYSSSQVTVLKDSFCDYESAVLYVDGEVIDAQQVKGI